MAPVRRNELAESARTVAKALGILEFVGLKGRSSLAEISRQTRLPKSTLHRLIKTLINEGFVQRTVHGQYCGTVKLWRIGANAVDYDSIRQQALPILQRLVEETSETAHYAVYEGGSGVYLEKVDGTHPIRSYTAVGGRSPAYASATGKAILAWRDEREIAEIGRTAQRLTAATHVGAKELCRHAAEIRTAGFSVNRGEWRDDVWGIAAPIFGPTGDVLASVGISGPSDRIKRAMPELTVAVRKAAKALSFVDSLATSGMPKRPVRVSRSQHSKQSGFRLSPKKISLSRKA
jgi:DNA-binding IclR family transcriptional regulator